MPVDTAQMVKLVDAPASGAGDRKVVEVRVLFWAPGPPFQGVPDEPDSLKKPRFSAINWLGKTDGVPLHRSPMLASLLVFPGTNNGRYQHGSHCTGSSLRQGQR